jgi:hypothetical protein
MKYGSCTFLQRNWWNSTILHGATMQKIVLFIVTTVRTQIQQVREDIWNTGFQLWTEAAGHLSSYHNSGIVKNITELWLYLTNCLTPSIVQMQLVQGVGNPESPTATERPPIWQPCGVSFHLVRSIWGSEWQATLGFLKANSLSCHSNIFLLIPVSFILSMIQSSSDSVSMCCTLLETLWSVDYNVGWGCVPWLIRIKWF